jgi:hypothetical protein
LVQPLKRKGYLGSIRFDLRLPWTQLSSPHSTTVRPRRQDPLIRRPCRSTPASLPPDGRLCSPPPAASSPLDSRPVLSAAGRIQPAGPELRVPPACTDGNGQVVLHVHQQAGPVSTRWRCSSGCVPEQFHFTCIYIVLDAAAGFSIQGSDVLFAGRDFLLKTSMQCLTSHMI